MLWSRRVRSMCVRAAFFLLDHRWMLSSVVLGFSSIVGIWWPLPAYINGTLGAFSLFMLIRELRQHIKVRSEIVFPERPGDRFEDVESTLQDDPRFQFWRLSAGNFVLDRSATAAIANDRVTAHLADEQYRLPPEIQELGQLFQRRRSGGLDFYDGHALGLNTNLGDKADVPSAVILTPARYSQHLASDIFAMHDVEVARVRRAEFGRRLFINRHGHLRDFGSSWLLNGIGTSVVAITSDGKLLTVEQSSKSLSSPGLVAPSGSGSLESKDFLTAQGQSFRSILISGALREFSEETGIQPNDVDSFEFLGFGRWLEKAGKPEAFTLAYLRIDSDEALRRQIPESDRPFSRIKETTRISLSAGATDTNPETVLAARHVRDRASLPLQVALKMLISAASDHDHHLYTSLRDARIARD